MKMLQSGKKNGNMGYFIYGFTVEGYNAWAADRLQKKLSQLTDEEKALCAAFCERAKDVSPESSVPLMRSGHAIELSTVFNHPEETFVTGRLFDETFSKTMRKMWVQFAKTGNPSLAADISPDGKDHVWTPYDIENKHLTVFEEFDIHMEKESDRKLVDWDRTYFLTQYYC